MRYIYRKCFFILLASCCICSSNACPTSCYCQAVSEGGNVDCNTKGLNIVPTNIPTYVKKLYLYSNSIKDVNREVFSDLTNLEILQLGDNVIGNLDSSFFENLDKLTNLHLQQNNITTLPVNVFSNLKSLQVLYLYENSIQEYDTDVFKGLHQLRELYLQNNRISNLTTNVFVDLQLMEILDVSQNQLQSLPSTVFSNLISLRILYIYSNFITTISEHTFWNLDNLEQIDIYDNKISTIENTSFGDLPALTKIQLHYNLITCDCYVRWFRDWLLSRPTLGTAYATCKTSGIYITDVTDDTFEECNGKKPCPSGWTGQNCDVDIEPPNMFDCPANMTVFTSELTKTVEWSVPEFIDPNNESLEVFKNYQEAKWTFPWGDFNVSY
ncbi:leucine-rich repeat-containing G-protein coupled receptor 4-like [Mytilus edulis]|uniref:leucine-rich repeat-containing G-protein coupled receptor 4-like n=1 Tax=Mytilus edulis TaxID=6550 RepID=UPI0039EE49C9